MNIEEICKRKYPVKIHWVDEEEGYYFAYMPDWGELTVSARSASVPVTLSVLKQNMKSVALYHLSQGIPIPDVSKPPWVKAGREERLREDFIEAAEPLMKWLGENCHPHMSASVTCTRAELVEGVVAHMTEKFIKD